MALKVNSNIWRLGVAFLVAWTITWAMVFAFNVNQAIELLPLAIEEKISIATRHPDPEPEVLKLESPSVRQFMWHQVLMERLSEPLPIGEKYYEVSSRIKVALMMECVSIILGLAAAAISVWRGFGRRPILN